MKTYEKQLVPDAILVSIVYGSAFAQKNNVLIQKLKALSDISQLPVYVEGSGVAMLSLFDRTGGNDDGFNGTYSFVRKEVEDRLNPQRRVIITVSSKGLLSLLMRLYTLIKRKINLNR